MAELGAVGAAMVGSPKMGGRGEFKREKSFRLEWWAQVTVVRAVTRVGKVQARYNTRPAKEFQCAMAWAPRASRVLLLLIVGPFFYIRMLAEIF